MRNITNKGKRIRALIEMLEQVRQRPAMYIYPLDGRSAENFISGVYATAYTLGLGDRRKVWWEAQIARGWEMHATGPVPQMEERNMTAEQIVDEVLAIEIDAWTRLLDSQNTTE